MRIKQHLARPLSRLFGPAAGDLSASPDPTAAEGSNQAQAAFDAGDETLHAAAIAKLTDGEELRRLAGLSGEAPSGVTATLERAAQERLAQLIDAGSLDEAERRALIFSGASSRIRQLAAQSVSNPVELRQLLKQLQGKDKNVYKVIREKCDALNAEEHMLEKARSDAIRACESLERHAHRTYETVYEPTLRHFHGRWQALETYAAPAVRERATHAMARCEEIVAEHRQRVEEELAAAAAHARREAERAEALLLAEIESVRRREQAEREAAQKARLREAEETARAAAAAAEASALREVNALVGKTHAALREGATGRASGLRRALEEKLTRLPAVPLSISRQVHTLDTSLGELKAWKEHAVAPKRAELIGEMEAIVGAALEPAALAERIRQLQNDWKTVSKGVLSDSDADWQRFHRAAERAYQPCREHFEAQAKLRQSNVERRNGILERLRVFEAAQAGDNADWRALTTVLREAPQEWRRHFPVERAAARAQQKEYDAAIGRLQGRLDTWHARNAEEKQLLIRRAAALVDLPDGREATDGVKRLQAQWKEAGPAAADRDRALWEDFRGHCDAVFQKRKQAHTDHTAHLQSSKAQAAVLCGEVEQWAQRSGVDLLDGAAKIAAWRAAFEALGELPRSEERGLRSRFARALERLQASISAQRARQKEQSREDLLEAASRVHAYGCAVSRGAPAAETEALKQTAESFIGAIAHWPRASAEALAKAVSAAQAAKPADAADENALRMLCVRSEILMDLPTPAEDQSLRRKYQMQRLVERMGRGIEGVDDSAEILALEWTRRNCDSPSVYQSLLERFRGSLRASSATLISGQ